MATPITYGLVIEGQDAIEFDEYMKNPTFTKKGLDAFREAYRRIKNKEYRELFDF